ncbi:hypothetical protein Golob_005325 [Gossypium lobatum]|uniref:Uncharacterized protein n=1 Tax=Gossypium lobatum TaxID=34289 RepID=A0A7J8MSU4_9ROSI|nr:hypothetical protein [Gossypium lobatum]
MWLVIDMWLAGAKQGCGLHSKDVKWRFE